MVRLAGKPHPKADQPDDTCDDPDLDPLRLEHGALLDVQLEVSAQLVHPACARNALEVEAELGHRLGKEDAVGVAALGEFAQIFSDERPAAEERRAEAGAFLIHERDQPERPARLDPALLEEADRLETREDPKGAVVAAAARNRVQVRADRNRLARACFPSSDQIPRCVDFDLEP